MTPGRSTLLSFIRQSSDLRNLVKAKTLKLNALRAPDTRSYLAWIILGSIPLGSFFMTCTIGSRVHCARSEGPINHGLEIWSSTKPNEVFLINLRRWDGRQRLTIYHQSNRRMWDLNLWPVWWQTDHENLTVFNLVLAQGWRSATFLPS